jgi:hypothetical protein
MHVNLVVKSPKHAESQPEHPRAAEKSYQACRPWQISGNASSRLFFTYNRTSWKAEYWPVQMPRLFSAVSAVSAGPLGCISKLNQKTWQPGGGRNRIWSTYQW